jgi:hypothetical protein
VKPGIIKTPIILAPVQQIPIKEYLKFADMVKVAARLEA